MKKILFLLTFVLLAFFSFSIQAQELALFKSGDVIDTVIQNAKIAEWTGDKSVYIVEFEIANNLSKDQEGIKYALELYNSSKEYGKFLVDQKVYDETVKLDPEEMILKRVQYDFPVSLQGEYELQLLITTDDGIELDRKTLGNIGRDKVEGIFIDITQCQNKIGFEENHIFKEMDLTDNDSFEIRCKNLKNVSDKNLNFNAKVVIRQQTKFGEVIDEKVLDKKNLKPNKEQDFSFKIPAINKSIYKYKGELFLINSNKQKVSNSIYFSYMIKMDENGDIIKDPSTSEIMEINQNDSQENAENFSFATIVTVILTSAFLLVVILIFRMKKKN